MNERRKLICVWKRAISQSQHVRKMFEDEKRRRLPSINHRRSRKAFALITMFAAIDNDFRLLVQISTADRLKCGAASSTFTFLVFSSNFLHSKPLFHSHRRVRMHFSFVALTHILNITKTIFVRFSLSSFYSSNIAVFN